jgi:alpha-L-arabinofuranosidase
VLVLNVVNSNGSSVSAAIRLNGFAAANAPVEVQQLSGALDAANTAANLQNIVPARTQWQPAWVSGGAAYAFPPYSFTVITFRGKLRR